MIRRFRFNDMFLNEMKFLFAAYENAPGIKCGWRSLFLLTSFRKRHVANPITLKYLFWLNLQNNIHRC